MPLVADVDVENDSDAVDRADVVASILSVRIPDRSIQSRSQLIQWTVLVKDNPDHVVVEDPKIG